MNHVITLLLAPILFTLSLNGWVCNYAKLYNPSTLTTVDILYDVHQRHPQDGLYPTEAKLHTILTELNRATSEEIEIVWESSPEGASYELSSGLFLQRYPSHIKASLRNFKFTYADTCRFTGYSALFEMDNPFDFFVNEAGSTFDEPFPFSEDRKNQIKLRAGTAVFDNYQALYSQTVTSLKHYFSNAYRNRNPVNKERDFLENDRFHAIADLEMLFHILVSEKSRIIMYCGAQHSANITSFLEGNGYIRLFPKKLPYRGYELHELNPSDLQLLHIDGGMLLRQQQEELHRCTQEETRKQTEAAQKAAEERQRQQEETRRKTEAAQKAAEERQRQQEETRRKTEAAQKAAEEQRSLQEETRRKTEAAQRAAEEERRQQEEARRKTEAAQRAAEEERRQQEEARRKTEAAQRAAEEERRQQEEARRKTEAAQKAAEEEQRQQEEARRKTEAAQKAAEERQRQQDEAKRKTEAVQKATAIQGRQHDAAQIRTEVAQKDVELKKSATCDNQGLYLISGGIGLIGYGIYDRYFNTDKKTKKKELLSNEERRPYSFWRYVAGGTALAAIGFAVYKYNLLDKFRQPAVV